MDSSPSLSKEEQLRMQQSLLCLSIQKSSRGVDAKCVKYLQLQESTLSRDDTHLYNYHTHLANVLVRRIEALAVVEDADIIAMVIIIMSVSSLPL